MLIITFPKSQLPTELEWKRDESHKMCYRSCFGYVGTREKRRLLCKHREKFSLFTSFSLFLESWGVYTTVLPLDEAN